MEKYFMLSAAPYMEVNAIRVSSTYDKRQHGYIVVADTVVRGNGTIGKCYCPEYYQHKGDGIYKVFEAGRRSAKKEAEAAAYCEANATDIAEHYLQLIINKLEITNDMHIIKEA